MGFDGRTKGELWKFSIKNTDGLRDLFRVLGVQVSVCLSAQHVLSNTGTRDWLGEALELAQWWWFAPFMKSIHLLFHRASLTYIQGQAGSSHVIWAGFAKTDLSLTLSALSLSTPYLPPKPLAASIWEECFCTSATYSWPTALWEKPSTGWVKKVNIVSKKLMQNWSSIMYRYKKFHLDHTRSLWWWCEGMCVRRARRLIAEPCTKLILS